MDIIKEMTDRGVDKFGTLFLYQQGVGLTITLPDGSEDKPFTDCRHRLSPEGMDKTARYLKGMALAAGIAPA